MGTCSLMGTEFLFATIRKTRSQWRWLHNTVDVVNATELSPEDGCGTCISPQ